MRVVQTNKPEHYLSTHLPKDLLVKNVAEVNHQLSMSTRKLLFAESFLQKLQNIIATKPNQRIHSSKCAMVVLIG